MKWCSESCLYCFSWVLLLMEIVGNFRIQICFVMKRTRISCIWLLSWKMEKQNIQKASITTSSKENKESKYNIPITQIIAHLIFFKSLKLKILINISNLIFTLKLPESLHTLPHNQLKTSKNLQPQWWVKTMNLQII